MALTTTYEKRPSAVTFLKDLDVQMVSLVPKGANWVPFHQIVQKSQKGGGNKLAAQVIHSVVLPDTVEWQEFAKRAGFEWMNEAKPEVFGKATKFVQVVKSAFVPGSLDGFSEPDTGGIIVVGDLKPRSRKKFAKATALVMGPTDEAPTDTAQPDLFGSASGVTPDLFRVQDELAGEWQSVEKSLFESLTTKATTAERREKVMKDLEGFTDYIGELFDKLPDDVHEVVKFEKAEWSPAYKNRLPDSCFAAVESNYDPSKEGFSDKNARHLPYRDADGNLDYAHVKNGLFSRLNQIKPVLGKDTAEELRAKAKPVLERAWSELQSKKKKTSKSGTEGNTEFADLSPASMRTIVQLMEAVLTNAASVNERTGPPMLPLYPGLQKNDGGTKMANSLEPGSVQGIIDKYIEDLHTDETAINRGTTGNSPEDAYARSGIAKEDFAKMVEKAITDYAGHTMDHFGKIEKAMAKMIKAQDGLREMVEQQKCDVEKFMKGAKPAVDPPEPDADDLAGKREAKKFAKALKENPELEKLFHDAVADEVANELRTRIPGTAPAADTQTSFRKGQGQNVISNGSIW